MGCVLLSPMQGTNFEKLKKACTDYRDACIKVEGKIGPLNLVAAAFLRCGLPLMTVVGVFLVDGGTLTVPEFALFLLVGTRVFDCCRYELFRTDDVQYVGRTDLYPAERTGNDRQRRYPERT